MKTTNENYLCSNCHAPFHGVTACKLTVDGNDPLFVAINSAADILIDLAKYADKRNQPALEKEAVALYSQVIALGQLVNRYAQPKK